jgi:hypothetical protein
MNGQNVFSDDFRDSDPRIVYFESPYKNHINDAKVYGLKSNSTSGGHLRLELLGSEKDFFVAPNNK